MTNERDHLKFIILRYDNYILGANTKGNFLLAINTFLTGVIIANYSKLVELICCPDNYIYLQIPLIVLFLLSICATYFVLKAVYPFSESGNSDEDNYRSHIFSNSVADFDDAKSFNTSFVALEDKQVEYDMSIQAYQLAIGLKEKYNFLEWSMKFVYAELVALLFLLTVIIIF